MLFDSRTIPAAAVVGAALGVFGCTSSDDGTDGGADTGGTGAGGSVTSGSGGNGATAGSSGAPSGGAGSGGAGAVGGSAGGAEQGGTSGTGGMPPTGGVAGTPSGGAGAGGAGTGGASGSGGTAGDGIGGMAGAGRAGAGGAGTGGTAGAGGSGGAPNCTSRTGGAIIDFRVCNQTMRFWITNTAFITEAIRLRGNGQARIACFPQPMDGRDCDPVLTYHANPMTPYWTDFELETYFTCPQEVEGNKSFWLEQVGQFCGETTSVTAVDDNR